MLKYRQKWTPVPPVIVYYVMIMLFITYFISWSGFTACIKGAFMF